MSITPDTIGPDGPPLSTEGWEAGVREMSSDELRVALRQARKDGAEMRRQRDLAVKLRELLAERDALRAQLAEAEHRAELNHNSCLHAMGELEDLKARTVAQLRGAAGHLAVIEEMHT